ncbi:MAG: hypothetical protein IIA87_02395 [Nanoarchaeota archaeon]|nr:hypothetical protein [Nanoarchaeota archaeon]
MVEENKIKNEENVKKEKVVETKTEEKVEKIEGKKIEAEKKEPEKKGKRKKEKPKIKKEEAIAWGRNLHISKKQGVYICEFIKNKKIDGAIKDIEEVIKLKRAIPFKGEIPHRKGKGIMSGRYPVKATKLFINVLKALRGNSIVNGLDLDKTRIYFASASWASRPMRSRSRRAKRTNVILKAREISEVKKQ